MDNFEDFKIIRGFPEHLRRQAAGLYFKAFEGKIGGILNRDGRGIRFIELVISSRFAISATSSDGSKLLGIAGYKTSDGSLVGGTLTDLASVYGWFGAIWRAIPLSLLERELEEQVLLMDGIAVAEEARGLGIGTKLLHAIIKEAEHQGKNEVRLDVIDTNPRAKALYERNGFIEQKTEKLGPFSFLFGFSASTTMKYTI